MQTSTQKHIFIDITLVDMKLWPIKDNGVIRPLPALPGGNFEYISVQWVCKVAEF